MDFITTPEEAKSVLDHYGVAIVPNVLSKSEAIQMQYGMWETLEGLTQTWELPIRRENPHSWGEMGKLYPKHSMLHQHHGIGHAPFVWNVRQNPSVVNVFSHIWKCPQEDLLCSFDGASFHMPHEATGKGYFRNLWLHVDQSYTRNEFECIQGWVTGYDVREGDATLCVMPKSHILHAEVAKKFNITEKEDWYKLGEEHLEEYRAWGCKETRIVCPRGSMVLWDSRTVHCGVEPLKERERANFRCVVYTCYMPRSMTNTLQKRITAFEEGRMTTHWPCKVKLFGTQPRTYGGDVYETTPLPRPTITELGRRLIGY